MRRCGVFVAGLACIACGRFNESSQLIVVAAADSAPPTPRVSAFVSASTLIGVVVAVDSIERGWYVSAVRAVSGGDTSLGRTTLDGRRLRDTSWLAVAPGTRYGVSAKIVSTTIPERASQWSDAIPIATPAAPRRAPNAPNALDVTVASPYAVRLTWADRSPDEYGFAIERALPGGLTFERVGLTRPNVANWVYSGLAPGDSVTFRITSFNEAGVSAPTPPRGARTLGDVGLAVAELQASMRDSISACIDPSVDLSQADDDTDGDQPRLYRNIPFGKHRVDMRAYLCGNANCSVTLYAQLHGCRRAIGDLFFVPGDATNPGWHVIAVDADGWPVIAALGHMNAFSFSLTTYQLLEGRYRAVDGLTYCGRISEVGAVEHSADTSLMDADPRSVDLRRMRPPFNYCRLDDPLRSR